MEPKAVRVMFLSVQQCLVMKSKADSVQMKRAKCGRVMKSKADAVRRYSVLSSFEKQAVTVVLC
jgi:hypothetical protein